ncbi:hypothetical protein MTR67_008049 [Solanum verrucosum]|uniref:BURP domain-containing protein n=1 Tax=Solanum verrucosum TaxID=315347 RepID=A0AAF0TDL4_SOLVR|nr:hypothetical protein MTR67_008049 [Solanum verrucosum]
MPINNGHLSIVVPYKRFTMKFQLLYSLTICLLAFVASSDAAISPEIYWKIKLPNTRMPKVIRDFLLQAENDVGDTKEKVYYGLHQHGILVFSAATDEEIHDLKRETPNALLRQVIQESINSDFQDNNFLYKPYFLENDLEKGNIINFPSLKNKNEAPIWPRQFVESIPFSSKKIPEILNHFSINSSKDAETIKETIKFCEAPTKKGQKQNCATSLESMVDFGIFMLGTNNVKVIATEVQGENQMLLQKYTIEEVEQIGEGVNMVCHKLNYAYAVHFCHGGGITKTFMVSMIGVDGTKVKAVSICHKDTSLWNPKGLPFVVLNVKPGTTTICHFLQDDQIAFLPYEEA